MAEYNEQNLTDEVIKSYSKTESKRFNEILASIIKHTHAIVREVNLTHEEWFKVIEFLTATGKKCDDKRQEFILLSDVLGISMMLEMVNNRNDKKGTDSTVLGPFHTNNAPVFDNNSTIAHSINGEVVNISGTVKNTNGKPISGAKIDVWQAGPDGMYDVQKNEDVNLRGILTANDRGAFNFNSIMPKYYPVPTDGPVGELLHSAKRHPYRPAHIHFLINAPGYKTLTTHLFVKGDKYIDSDAVFAVRDSLIVNFNKNDKGNWSVYYDFVLEEN